MHLEHSVAFKLCMCRSGGRNKRGGMTTSIKFMMKNYEKLIDMKNGCDKRRKIKEIIFYQHRFVRIFLNKFVSSASETDS